MFPPCPLNKLDLVVADMNIHPYQAVKICFPLLQHLRTGGALVMTMKFFGVGRDRTDVTQVCKDILGDAVTDVECIWLFANTVNERVLVARRTAAAITPDQLAANALPAVPGQPIARGTGDNTSTTR